MINPRIPMRQTARLINGSSRVIRRKPLQPVKRRAYSSGGAHGTTQASSDLPWAIGAVVVTIPSLSYILWPKEKKDHEHDHGGSEGHGDSGSHTEHKDGTKNEDGGTEDGDAQDEQSKGDENSQGSKTTDGEEGGDKTSGAAEDNESDDKSSIGEEQGQDTPESSDDEEAATTENVEESNKGQKEPQFKGPAKDGPPSDNRVSIADSKGANKKRIESSYGKPQQPAEGENSVNDDLEDGTDKAAAAKSAGNPATTMSGKQEGLSNTDTKHSTDIINNPEKSKKPGGQPETAKLKGTVDPKPDES